MPIKIFGIGLDFFRTEVFKGKNPRQIYIARDFIVRLQVKGSAILHQYLFIFIVYVI